MHKRILLTLVATAALSSCGNPIDCAINGDNLTGRVTFGSNVNVSTDTSVIIQHSTDSFSTTSGSTSKANPQGLLTLPYGFCVATGTYQVRAFQDLNGNGSLDVGEPTGNVTKSVTKTSNDTYDRVTDAHIVLNP